MNAMFKLFYNTIAACQRPVGPLLSNKCMYVLELLHEEERPGLEPATSLLVAGPTP